MKRMFFLFIKNNQSTNEVSRRWCLIRKKKKGLLSNIVTRPNNKRQKKL